MLPQLLHRREQTFKQSGDKGFQIKFAPTQPISPLHYLSIDCIIGDAQFPDWTTLSLWLVTCTLLPHACLISQSYNTLQAIPRCTIRLRCWFYVVTLFRTLYGTNTFIINVIDDNGTYYDWGNKRMFFTNIFFRFNNNYKIYNKHC